MRMRLFEHVRHAGAQLKSCSHATEWLARVHGICVTYRYSSRSTEQPCCHRLPAAYARPCYLDVFGGSRLQRRAAALAPQTTCCVHGVPSAGSAHPSSNLSAKQCMYHRSQARKTSTPRFYCADMPLGSSRGAGPQPPADRPLHALGAAPPAPLAYTEGRWRGSLKHTGSDTQRTRSPKHLPHQGAASPAPTSPKPCAKRCTNTPHISRAPS